MGRLSGSASWRANRAIGRAAVLLVAAFALPVTVMIISVDRVSAYWTVDGEVGESSQAIPIRAAHPDCPSWSNLGGLVVTTQETDETVTLTVTFPSYGDRPQCDWMGNAMRASIKLDEPLGDRILIDGATGDDPSTPASIAFRTGQAPND